MLEPKCLNGLVEQNVVPLIGLRSPDVFQRTFQVIGIIGYNCRGCLVRGWFLLAHCALILNADCTQCRNGVGLPCARQAGLREFCLDLGETRYE